LFGCSLVLVPAEATAQTVVKLLAFIGVVAMSIAIGQSVSKDAQTKRVYADVRDGVLVESIVTSKDYQKWLIDNPKQ
jgi:hypothetical protein